MQGGESHRRSSQLLTTFVIESYCISQGFMSAGQQRRFCCCLCQTLRYRTSAQPRSMDKRNAPMEVKTVLANCSGGEQNDWNVHLKAVMSSITTACVMMVDGNNIQSGLIVK